jgi:folylpolyglutamate synthase/dihydropteroate synthase
LAQRFSGRQDGSAGPPPISGAVNRGTELRDLAQWLEYIERQHPQSIAMGLERVTDVLRRLDVRLICPVVTVGGTNGKGSTCAMLESILRAAGARTALYTSPHLLHYNERVRIGGREASDDALCEAFVAVERAREGVPLTYFEYGTLAACWLFAREAPDATILEVGLGGRLDAVNAIDPDAAVLTGIGIDHVEYLGATREDVGREKAGILRAGKPAIVADPDPPRTVLERAARIGAVFFCTGVTSDTRFCRDSGLTGGRAHGAVASRFRRCAEASSCATRPRQSPHWMRCATGSRSVRRTSGAGSRKWWSRGASRCFPAGRR